jgi:hypothetical protein
VVAVLHLIRLATGVGIFVGDHKLSFWLSLVAIVVVGVLAVLNLNLIKEKSKVFWLKFILSLIVFDGLFALYFWLNNLSCLGISPVSFLFIFIFDVVLVLVLSFYIKQIKSLLK